MGAAVYRYALFIYIIHHCPEYVNLIFLAATEINFSKQFVINCELLKYKSLGQAFSKACGVQRQSLGRSSQWAKSPVQTAKLSNHKVNCQLRWQFAFVRRALRKGWMLKIIQWIIFNRGCQHFIKSMIWFEMPMQGWRPASEGVP